MSSTVEGSVPEPADESAAAKKKKREDRPMIVFTEDGCRSEIRLGALLALAAVFFPLMIGPPLCVKIMLVGLALILVGVPLQVRDARQHGRPGYPWKLGLTLALGGTFMIWDLAWKSAVGAPWQVQELPAMLTVGGVWIVVGGLYLRFAPRAAGAEAGA